MREITHGDIVTAARVLLARPEPDWPALVARMLAAAHTADCHRKALGRVHPRLGAGTLISVAMAFGPAPVPRPSDSRYLRALAAVAQGVLAWRAARSPFP